jgi:parallel beta-helix repeat protein
MRSNKFPAMMIVVTAIFIFSSVRTTIAQNSTCTKFVDSNGSDSNDGSQANPWQHIQMGASSAQPGDVVCVDDGTYPESIINEVSGTSSQIIEFRPTNLNTPPTVMIAPPSGSGIVLNGQAYLYWHGFDIGGSGCLFGVVDSQFGHHTTISYNYVHDCQASGIQLNDGDYRTIEWNTVTRNAGVWSGSGQGIGIFEPTNYDDATGFHNIIAYNTSFGNLNPVGGTDGSGIAIDDTLHAETDNIPYTSSTLIENNLVYGNAGAGIHLFLSTSAVILNNTAYGDRLLLNSFTWRGDCSNQQDSNIVWANNICNITSAGGPAATAALDVPQNENNVVWIDNITFDGVARQPSFNLNGETMPKTISRHNRLGVNPRFVMAGNDFHLAKGSAARTGGTKKYGVPATNLDGTPRRKGVLGIGAF